MSRSRGSDTVRPKSCSSRARDRARSASGSLKFTVQWLGRVSFRYWRNSAEFFPRSSKLGGAFLYGFLGCIKLLKAMNSHATHTLHVHHFVSRRSYGIWVLLGVRAQYVPSMCCDFSGGLHSRVMLPWVFAFRRMLVQSLGSKSQAKEPKEGMKQFTSAYTHSEQPAKMLPAQSRFPGHVADL